MDRQIWGRWPAAAAYVLGAVLVVVDAVLGDPAVFLLGLTALAVALVVRGREPERGGDTGLSAVPTGMLGYGVYRGACDPPSVCVR